MAETEEAIMVTGNLLLEKGVETGFNVRDFNLEKPFKSLTNCAC
mgnify:CR=1 FL=1